MKRGFTIVEMLIVIVVIVILTTIGIVGYGEWRKDVTTKELHADLHSASAAMEQEKNFKNVYPATLPGSYKGNTSNISVYVQNAGAEFCLEAASSQPPLKFYIRSDDRRIQEGGCPRMPSTGGSSSGSSSGSSGRLIPLPPSHPGGSRGHW